MKSKALQISIAFIVGFICIYLFVQSIDDWGMVFASMENIHYGWLGIAIFFNILGIYLRAIRWQLFLGEPKVSVTKLFLIANIGFMGNGIFPARMGELIRPFLVWRSTEHTFPKALATIVVERVYDLMGLLLILAFVFIVLPFPVDGTNSIGQELVVERSSAVTDVESPEAGESLLSIDNPLEWIKSLAKYGLVIFFILFTAIGTLTFAPRWSLGVAGKLLSPLPSPLSLKILSAIQSFEQGASTFRNPKEFSFCLFWTMMVWFSITYGELAVLYAFGIDSVSFAGALFLMVGLCFAVMFPQLPGYIGMFQLAVMTILTQTFFIEKSTAGGIAIVMWLTQIPSVVIAGFISLLIMGVSFTDIRKIQTELPKAVEPE
jgi:glycosyltransferase 2 family protein